MVVKADERLTEFINWMTNPYLPTSRYHRLREEEDYENFLADAPISYISEGVWEYGPGFVCVVVGIRQDYTYRAEVWQRLQVKVKNPLICACWNEGVIS